MIISGNVPEDYSDIVTGINALIASGLASGDINEFYLYVDDSYYTGVFNASVPNSGDFYIFGNQTTFAPQNTCNVSTDQDGSFNFVDIDILGEDTSSWLFNISGASTLTFDRSSIIYPFNGIKSDISGYLEISNSYMAGSGAGVFYSGYSINLLNSDMSNFSTGIYGEDIVIKNSNIIECTIGLDVSPSGSITMEESLMHDCNTGISKTDSSSIIVTYSTINAVEPINGSGGVIHTYSTIYDARAKCINDYLESGSIVQNCGLYPSGWSSSDVVNTPTTENNSTSYADFNNPSYGDYRLKFDYTNGSDYVEHTSKSVPSDVSLRCEISNIMASDNKGALENNEILRFNYKQGNTLLHTDYGKEIEYAYFVKDHQDLNYIVTTHASFSIEEQNLKSCLSKNGDHDQPYDWNLRTFQSPEIVKDDTDFQYIIPRTYIDLDPIINKKLSFLGDVQFRYDRMNKSNIKVYNQEISRGIAYDFNLSSPGQPVLWRIEGRNQLLIKQNPFTQEDIKFYPLLSPDLGDNNLIQISGLAYVGIRDDKYRFIDVNDPNKDYIGENEQGYFKWIDTTMNPQFDVRGILSYKNNLYITGTRYSEDIYDRTEIPQLDSAGYILRYYNDSKLSYYIKSLDSLGNRKMSLDDSNSLPTDITIYEDGNIFISDYANNSGLYRYEFAYDYALIAENYDRLSTIWLREFYPTINF